MELRCNLVARIEATTVSRSAEYPAEAGASGRWGARVLPPAAVKAQASQPLGFFLETGRLGNKAETRSLWVGLALATHHGTALVKGHVLVANCTGPGGVVLIQGFVGRTR